MEFIDYIFEHARDLDMTQFALRTFIIFFVALIYLRISGRRSFGLSTPLDVVVTILLGGMLGRALAGINPFGPTLLGAAVLVVTHRLCALAGLFSKPFGALTKGVEIVVFENGEFNKRNMLKCQVSRKDLLVSVRQNTHTDSFEKVEKIYVERDGGISIITKKES